MAIAREFTTKDGRRCYELRAFSAAKNKTYTKRWEVPSGWSRTTIEARLKTQLVNFQNEVNAGLVLTKKEKAAEDEAARIKAEREAAAAAEEIAKLKTVRQYAEQVFMPAKELTISENTRLSYKMNLDRHILPVLGDFKVVDVTPAMITALLANFQKNGHSHASCVKLYNVINGLFDMALFDDTIPASPMAKVKRPRQRKDDKAKRETKKAYSAEELGYILDCVTQEPLKWQAFLNLAADTGARRGEICGLQWQDIDFETKTVLIKHNLQFSKDRGVYDAAPKGGRYRSIDIGDDTIAVLTAYKKSLTGEDKEKAGAGAEESAIIDLNEYRQKQEQSEKSLPKWVFTIDGEDAPMFPTSPTRFFTDFAERYNLPGFHPHLLRHTSATLSLLNGSDFKSVADRLGHKDASTLLRNYAHSDEESIRRAGDIAREAIKRAKEKKKQEQEKAEEKLQENYS